MPVEERRRLALRDRVSASWGEKAADTLFELLAPAGQDPATRQDVHQGFAQVDRRFAAVEDRFEARFSAMGEHFERRISDAVTTQTRTLVLSQLAALVAIAGLAFGLG